MNDPRTTRRTNAASASRTTSTGVTAEPGRGGVLASMCLALVLVVASVSSVNLALTSIGLDLGASSSQLTWIADGYTVALAALVWAGFASSGAILGLLTCGLILEFFSWRATFVATAVLAAVTLVAAIALAPNTSDREEAIIDLPGYLLSGIGVGALVFGIIDGAEVGWSAASALTGLMVALVALIGFVLWELRTPTPMLDVRLFTLRGFGTGSLALTMQFLCLFGFFLVGLQFLQLVLGYSPLHSAICLLPLGMIVMPMSRKAPHVVDRFGQRAVMTTGLTSLAVGLTILSTLQADSTYWHFLGGLVVFGLGMAFTSTPATTAIVTSLPRAKQGVASAMNDVSREVGSAIGIAILGSLFNSGYRDAVSGATGELPPEAAHAITDSAGAGFAVAERLDQGTGQLSAAVGDAFVSGLSDAVRAGAVIALAAACFVAWRAPRRTASAHIIRPDDDLPRSASLIIVDGR
jgi:MFS family permease